MARKKKAVVTTPEYLPTEATNLPPAPWEILQSKQLDLFNCNKRIVLASGARKSGKTFSCLMRVVRHLWETPGARVGIFAKSIKLAKESGSWQELVEIILPMWFEAGIVGENGKPIEFTTIDSDGIPGQKQDPQTRTAYFRIRNYWGGESEARLFSIDHDDDVESKVKNKSFSMIYFVELSMFKTKRILTVTLPSLRMPHLRPKNGELDKWHMWIADTNPDVELGDKSWFYKLWYGDRLKQLEDTPDNKEARMFYDSMALFEFFLEDNKYITEQEKVELKMSCQDDEALYDSYFKGVHGQGSKKRNKLFAAVFIPSKHVVGGGDDEDDQIDVCSSSGTLYGGWDLGSSKNHAVMLWDKRYRQVKDPHTNETREESVWCLLDELVSIDERLGLGEITQMVMDKIEAIEKKSGRKFEWTHWSDSDAIDVWRPSSETYDYLEVRAYSQGTIELMGVDKPKFSVAARIRLLKKLLREERLFISARCTAFRAMLENAQRDEKVDFVGDMHKHPFDAGTYPIYMECRSELIDESLRKPIATKNQLPAIIGV